MGPLMKTTMKNAISYAAARLARFVRERRGVSTVEFAMLLPMMMTLFLGGVETSQGVATKRKVSLTAHALADLATQYTDITNAEMSNILSAASAIMTPYPVAGLTAVVSEISINSSGIATVVWSDTLNGTALAVGNVVTLPGSLAVPNTNLIFAQVQYNYNPTYGYVLTGTMTLSDQIYMAPRQSSSIARTAS
jgi:Flp pilus assembly protein TadG